jgi:hypothetical protein
MRYRGFTIEYIPDRKSYRVYREDSQDRTVAYFDEAMDAVRQLSKEYSKPTIRKGIFR